MAWLFVPELEDLSLGSESSGPDFEPSVMLSGKATQRPLSWRGWASRPWIKHLSGTISAPSTASRGVIAFLASLGVSRASHSVWPESVEDSQMSGGLATISSGWSMKYEIQPGGSSSCWKTSQVSLWPEDSTASSEDWRRLSRAGGVQNGCAYPRAPWVPLTDVNASSDFSWPTPRTITGGAESAERKQELGRTESGGGDLQAAAQKWPTPTASDNGEKVTPQTRKGSSLLAHADKWPTPTATATDAKASGTAEYSHLPGRYQGVTLTDATVRASRLGLPTVTAGESGSPQEGRRQRLNPAFVEALMGLPPGWSLPTIGCGASGTQLWLSRQRRRLASLLGV